MGAMNRDREEIEKELQELEEAGEGDMERVLELFAELRSLDEWERAR